MISAPACPSTSISTTAPSRTPSRPSVMVGPISTLTSRNDLSPNPDTAYNFWPDTPHVYNHNSKTNASSDKHPKIYFPHQLPSPTGIPIRPPPCFPKLAELDEVYNKIPHRRLSSQGVACGGYNETQDEEALKTLEAHIKARTPYVELTASRLQAACGVRNENIFDLPGPPGCKMSPSAQARHLTPEEHFDPLSTDKGGVKAISAARGKRNKSLGFAPKSPIGMQAVDKKTGKGLREFLLQKGKECGMRKQECNSITFHDFTPDMRSGYHNNALLGHYGVNAGEKGERIDVYEIDLPASQRDENAGEDYATSETWIWILISRPLMSFDPEDTSTFVALKSPASGSPALDIFYTPCSKTASAELTTVNPTPPNFPYPTPLSWLVFAAPKAHITTYPSNTENHDGSISNRPHHFTNKSKKVYKRTDYDFSFSGIPLFEFSSTDIFTATSVRHEFLSIEQMGGWSESDPFSAYSDDEYQRMYSLWEDGEWDLSADAPRAGRFDKDGRPTAPIPPPNRGAWWKVFYERMATDVERWKMIRTAMGRGKCRVVVRWTETLDEQGLETNGLLGVSGKLLGGSNGAQGKRLTRSETRRRSGLSVSETPLGLAIDGVDGLGALGESSKLRAGGCLGRAVAVGVDKEKAKARKR